MNLPKHSYVFLRKHLEESVYQVSAVSASDVLKREILSSGTAEGIETIRAANIKKKGT